MVHQAGGGRLEEVARHRAVDQGTDLIRAKPRAVEGLAGGDGGHGTRGDVRRPDAAGAHATDPLQRADWDPEPFVDRGDPLFDLGGRQQGGGEIKAERLQADMLEPKRNHQVLLTDPDVHRRAALSRHGTSPGHAVRRTWVDLFWCSQDNRFRGRAGDRGVFPVSILRGATAHGHEIRRLRHIPRGQRLAAIDSRNRLSA